MQTLTSSVRWNNMFMITVSQTVSHMKLLSNVALGITFYIFSYRGMRNALNKTRS
jgi:hypothetical protein